MRLFVSFSDVKEHTNWGLGGGEERVGGVDVGVGGELHKGKST